MDEKTPDPRVEARLTRIETQTETITVEMRRFQTALEKLTDIVADLGKQQISTDMAVKAFIDRTEKHTDTIENLQKENIDTGKLLTQLTSEISTVKSRISHVYTVAGVVAGSLLTWFISNVLPHLGK